MEFTRVGDKLVSKEKLMRTIERILALRSSGMSQQEVSQKIGVDRTFISRLEALAEVRKGGSVAIIGFPLENKQELVQVADEHAIDYTFLMNDEERWTFIRSLNGKELLDDLMGLITKLRDFDVVIMIGSDMRIRLAEALLGDKVIGVQLGQSPIQEDVYFDPHRLKDLILSVKGKAQ